MDQAKAPEFDPSSPLQSGLSVLRSVLLSPRAFYLNFPASGSLGGPMLFVLLVSTVSAVLRLTLVLLFSTDDTTEAVVALLGSVAFAALSPVVVGALAGAYLLSVRTFVGRVGTFRELYRMLAYAYGAMIVFWIPIIGAFAFTHATLVLMGMGIRSVYRTSTMTAVVAALVGYVPAAALFIYLQVAVTRVAFG